MTIFSKYSDEYLYDWYPTLFCNFNCSYCYVQKNNKKFQPSNFFLFKNIINNFSKNKKIKIRILGGEPSLISNFNKYLKLLNKDIILELVTNGTGNLKNLTRINSFEISIHPEYYLKFKDKIFNNIKNINHNCKKTIVFNIYQNKNLDFYKIVLNDIKKNFTPDEIKISINPIIINKNKKELLNYESIYTYLNLDNFLSDEHEIEYYIKNKNKLKKIKFIDYIKIYKEFNCNFKNNICYNNYFRIDYNYNLFYNCHQKPLYNILKEKKLEVIKPLKCPNKFCDNGCFMDCKKIINQRNINE